VVEVLTLLFPVWLGLLMILAGSWPQSFYVLTTETFTLASLGPLRLELDPFSMTMGIAMLAMGTMVDVGDFRGTFQARETRVALALAFVIQFVATPLIALVLGLFVSPPTAIGLLLLASCPGSQLSNVATFIAGGHLPVSMVMSFMSTMASPLLTPLVFNILTGSELAIDDIGMLYSMCKVVLIPTLTGMYLRKLAPQLAQAARPITLLLSVILTSCLCAAPIAGLRQEIIHGGLNVAAPVFLLHLLSLALGYFIPRRLLNLSDKTAKTVGLEAGMQSAALGYLIGMKHFEDPNVAVPAAIGVVVMSWLGAVFSVVWRYQEGFAPLWAA
jgi:BASS family bile acid:Na+ symporter